MGLRGQSKSQNFLSKTSRFIKENSPSRGECVEEKEMKNSSLGYVEKKDYMENGQKQRNLH